MRQLGGRIVGWMVELIGRGTANECSRRCNDNRTPFTGLGGALSRLIPSIALLAACGGGADGGGVPTTPPAPKVGSVSVTMPSTTLRVGDRATATAEIRSVAGAALSNRAPSWTSSNATVASVSSSGEVTALSPGVTSIAATDEGVIGSVSLTVVPMPVQSITITTVGSAIIVGRTLQATALLRDERGTVLTDRPTSWTSSAPQVASVDGTGLISAVAVGTATITATAEGKSATLAVSVIVAPVQTVEVAVAPNAVIQGRIAKASAVLKDDRGSVLSGRSVTWRSSASNVATVDSNGTVTALTPGVAVVSATSEGRTGQASVTVTPPAVQVVTVSLSTTPIVVGATSQATALLLDDQGATLSDRVVTWTSSATAVATISASGAIVGVSPGTSTITATSEGRSGQATITVTSVPVRVASVTFTGALRQKVGDSYPMAVVAKASDGSVLTRAVKWSVREAVRARVTTAGIVTPLVLGDYTLVAEIDGVEWSATYSTYDFDVFTSGGSRFVSLDADVQVANYLGRLAYPQLIVSCSNTGYFFVWVRTPHIITASGLVTYSIDSGPIVTETWDELSPDFTTLWKRGTNAVKKFFATQIGNGRRFSFAFGEYLSDVRVTQWRVTALDERLPPLLSQCAANLRGDSSSSSDAAESSELRRLAALLPALRQESSPLRATLRGSMGALAAPMGSLISNWPVWRQPDQQQARREFR